MKVKGMVAIHPRNLVAMVLPLVSGLQIFLLQLFYLQISLLLFLSLLFLLP